MINEISSCLLTEQELASVLGVPVNTIRRWRKTLGLPHLGQQRDFLYRLSSVYAWMQAQEKKSTTLTG